MKTLLEQFTNAYIECGLWLGWRETTRTGSRGYRHASRTTERRDGRSEDGKKGMGQRWTFRIVAFLAASFGISALAEQTDVS